MEPFITYTVKSASILLLAIIYYQFFLKKQTFFNLNRIYLLAALLIAIAVPYITIDIILSPEKMQSATPRLTTYMSNMLEEVNVWGKSGTLQLALQQSSFNFLSLAYWCGVVFFAIRYLTGCIQIYLLVKRNPQKHIRNLHVVQLQTLQTTFSFFNFLFIPASLCNKENRKKIFEHEKIHMQQWHSLDLLVTEIICILNWFNPLVWFFKSAITENHEYIADQQVIRKFQTGSYLELLVQQTLKGAFSFTNHFSCSNLKKRTIMMTKKQSRRYRLLSYIPAIALISTLFYGFTCNITSQNTENQAPPEPESTQSQIQDTTVFVVVDHMPQFNGSVQEWIASHVKYPYEAMRQNIQGKVYVQFIIDEQGKVINPSIARGADSLLNTEALRVIGEMPDWTPGSQRGKKVKVSYTLPINFALSSSGGLPKPDTFASDSSVFVVVEDMPKFPQGTAKDWIVKNIKYPAQAMKKGLQGKVYIQFIIEKDGSLSNIKIVRGIDPTLDNEAVRVIKSMPKWIPGKQRGLMVRVSYVLPVNFELSK